ncbi:MAG TPA: hypothetical protein VJO13_06200 [Ktedonobacterales bacterium]|nr:hypothetical protein [Ktedonobacterales bacterium]
MHLLIDTTYAVAFAILAFCLWLLCWWDIAEPAFNGWLARQRPHRGITDADYWKIPAAIFAIFFLLWAIFH